VGTSQLCVGSGEADSRPCSWRLFLCKYQGAHATSWCAHFLAACTGAQALASPGELRERMAALASELLELDARAAYNDAEAQHTRDRADKMDADGQAGAAPYGFAPSAAFLLA